MVQLREQVKQRLLDAQRDVEARERDLAMRAAAMQAKNALARVRISPTLDGWDDLASAKSDNGSTHSEQSKHQVDDQFDSQPESHQPEEGYQADPSSSPEVRFRRITSEVRSPKSGSMRGNRKKFSVVEMLRLSRKKKSNSSSEQPGLLLATTLPRNGMIIPTFSARKLHPFEKFDAAAGAAVTPSRKNEEK